MSQTVEFLPRTGWVGVGAVPPAALHDARLQLHHAVQIAVSVPISYLHPEPDDSHTSLTWWPAEGALATARIPSGRTFRAAVRAADLSLLILDDVGVRASFALAGRTAAEAHRWLAGEIESAGIDPARLTARKHYEIPPHQVAAGAPFSLEPAGAFEEMTRWWSGGANVIGAIASAMPNASPVRCWPHHFDLATLISLAPAPAGESRTIGIGLSPGDDSYDEPYLYVGPYPYPDLAALPPLAVGHWHTSPWVGAVLQGSEVVAAGDAEAQRRLVVGFVEAAVAGCRTAMG